jgi:hypothetical protein
MPVIARVSSTMARSGTSAEKSKRVPDQSGHRLALRPTSQAAPCSRTDRYAAQGPRRRFTSWTVESALYNCVVRVNEVRLARKAKLVPRDSRPPVLNLIGSSDLTAHSLFLRSTPAFTMWTPGTTTIISIRLVSLWRTADFGGRTMPRVGTHRRRADLRAPRFFSSSESFGRSARAGQPVELWRRKADAAFRKPHSNNNGLNGSTLNDRFRFEA